MNFDCLLAGVVRVIGGVREIEAELLPSNPFVCFANHSSHLDFATIWAALPAGRRNSARPVAGRDYWQASPLRRWLAMRAFRAVLIERAHVTVASNPLKLMIEALDQGDSLIVFPEGTRSPDGKVKDFKGGLYHLARARPAVPLVPVYLQNLNRILPKGDFLPVPLLASLSVGKELRLVEGEDRSAFLSRARDAVINLET